MLREMPTYRTASDSGFRHLRLCFPRSLGTLFLLIFAAVLPVQAQSPPARDAAQPIEIAGESPDKDALHLQQLANCRAGITDPQARPEERRRWVDTLFGFDTPESTALIAELLQLRNDPAPVIAVCEAIASRTRVAAGQLHDSLVDPLLGLLKSENPSLRSAASQALADFPSPSVVEKLGEIASDPEALPAARLAAVDALSARVDDRVVVGILMSLLDQGSTEMVDRVLAALEPTTRESFGKDLDRWREWWREKSRMSDEDWLEDQTLVYRDRLRRTKRELQTVRQETQRQLEAANARLREFQRDLFRSISPDQREARLIAWLEDPLEEVRRTALSTIRSQIADEGRRPQGELLAALLRLLQSDSPAIRREVLQIVQTLKDPGVEEAVLALLTRERDPSVRQAVFKAVGQLESRGAVDEILREIEGQNSPVENVREAALALGQIAPRIQETQVRERVANVLRERYAALPPDDRTLRPALLSAMAGLGHPSFTEIFREAIELSDPGVLRSAARGLAAANDATKLPRLRMLTNDPDQLVRRAALEAVGILGREDADLEAVLARLSIAAEPSELIRDTAWTAFRELMGRRPPAAQVQASRQLRDMPELEIQYLEFLDTELSSSGNDLRLREEVLDRLSEVLIAQHNFDEAAGALSRLTDLVRQRGGDAFPAALRWLDAAMRGAARPNLTSIAGQTADLAKSTEEQTRLVDTVRQRFSVVDPQQADSTRAMLAALRKAVADESLPGWGQMLDEVEASLPEQGDSPQSPGP